MKLDGNAICSILALDFKQIECDKEARRLIVDFPILYDVDEDMSGHAVLIPDHERPQNGARLSNTICICHSSEVAEWLHGQGLPTIRLLGDNSFQHAVNLIQMRFVAFERWDTQMRAYVDTFSDFKKLLDTCADEMDHPCALIDAQYRTVCTAYGNMPAELLESELTEGAELFRKDAVDLITASSAYGRMRTSRKAFPIPGTSHLLMRNLIVKGDLVGVLVLYWDGDARSARYARFVLEMLARHAETLYARIGSFGRTSEKPSQLRAALKQALEGNLGNTAGLARMLKESGHAERANYILLQADRSFTNEGAEGFEYLARRLEQAIPHSYSIIARNAVFAFVDMDACEKQLAGRTFARTLPIILREELVKAGVSRPFTNLDDLEAARVQAAAALEQGSVDDPTYWSYRFDDYALAWITSHGIGGTSIEHVAHRAVSVLGRYDEAHRTELLHTLAVYVAQRYNVTAASKKLYVARSTLLNRLEKIDSLVAINLDDVDERTYLALSLALMKQGV